VGNANRIVYICLAALFVVAATFTLLNRGDQAHRTLEANRQYLVKIDGETVAAVGREELLALEPTEFTTIMATSSSLPRQVTFQGVELGRLLEFLEIDERNIDRVAFRGLDGYVSPVTPAEVERPRYVYICVSMDGEELKPGKDGGLGPYLMVMRGATFAQRWCKYIEYIDVKSKG
jgi:hypothetical protein